MGKITTGTREWSDSSVNIYSGCSNNCRYCYAKKIAIRFKRKTAVNWKVMELNEKAYNKGYKKRKGRIMFPTSHDITKDTYIPNLRSLRKILEVGNQILITTKPDLRCILNICNSLFRFQEQIQFRFTITSLDDEKLEHWEPNAPKFKCRLGALIYAKNTGYKTSISIEPCLDPDPRPLIEKLRPFVTESIWLGPMNYNGVHEFNTKEVIQNWYDWFKDDPLVRLKDSVYNKLGIEK